MKRTLLVFSIVAALASCNTQTTNTAPAVDVVKERDAILAADKAFSDMAGKENMVKAMEAFYDEEIVGIGSGAPVQQGKAMVLKGATEHKMDQVNTLSWKAEKASVAASGDMGYSWGYYQFKSKTEAGTDTIYYGAYTSIWKKQADGSWKIVLDHNSEIPALK